MRILVFAASLRRDSFNRKLARNAAALLGKQTGTEIDHADFREFETPIYDGDLEDASGIPRGGLELIRRVRLADAIVISTPEYNGGMPGTLKNALDWASREDEICFDGKPMLLIGTSPGRLGAVRGLWHTRVPFEVVGTLVYPDMLGLPRADQAFDDQDQLKDPKTLSRLEKLLTSFVSYSRAVSKTRGSVTDDSAV